MRRRDFLFAGALSCAWIAGCRPATRKAAKRRARRAAPPASCPPFELSELGIAELREGLAKKRWTATRLAGLYLARIASLDRRGPELRAMIAVNPGALAIAADLDRELAAGRSRGPLHGIPVVVKDNLDTHDRMPTTAGSLALAESFAARDAFVVERLRAAGAVLLGKTNLSEWANFRSTHSTSGWSAVGGACRNPYALDRNPCGSSSGTAAAISACYAAVGIGTETDGSIVCPASSCGLVGLKPTVGLVSRAGIVPISHSQDTAGPMARTVRDAAELLTVIAGPDPSDAATAQARVEDLTKHLDPDGLKQARLGVVRKSFGFHPEVDRLMEAALDAMKQAGAILVDPVELGGKLDDPEQIVLEYEFKADLDAYLAALDAKVPVHSLKELIDFNTRNADREMPFFGQELFEKAQARGPLTSPEYTKALDTCRRLSRAEGIDAALKKNRLDALVAPAGGPAWTTDLVNGDHYGGGSSTPAAVAGYPNITVPAGQVHGLPVGISFFSGAWSEPTLLRLAYAFEQATHHRKLPTCAPTA
jgi:amidase